MIKTDLAIEALMKHAVNDQEYTRVYQAVRERIPLHNLPKDHAAHQSKTGGYQNYWDALSTEETIPNLILYHRVIIVPHSAQAES